MKYRSKRTVAAAAVAILFLVTGCEKSATGQVAAVVNGEEISLQELNAELEGMQLPPNVDKKLIMRQLLQKVVDRRLLAQTAKADGLDRDPAYITQQRKLNEELLVSLYAKKAADSVRIPDPATVDKYIGDHPAVFAERKRFKVEQLQFEMPGDIEKLRQFEADHSLGAIADRLTAMGISFQRGNGSLDSGGMPPAMLKTILSLPPGEPFIVPAGGKVIANVVTGVDPIVVPQDQARQMAVQAIRNEKLAKIGESRLKEARAKAKIEYQPGYSPPVAKAAEAK